MSKWVLFFLLFSQLAHAKLVLTAHKTAGLEKPENSMQGFMHSLSLDVDAIEIDLHLTKDKVLVLSHDPVLDSENCFSKKSSEQMIIAQTMAADLLSIECTNHKIKSSDNKYFLPLFEDVLNKFIQSGKSQIELNVEIKVLDKLIENAPRYEGLDTSTFHYSHKEVAGLVYAAIRKSGLASNILFSTFSRELLLILKKEMSSQEDFRFGLLFKGDYAPIRLGLIAWFKGLSCYDNCWWPSWKNARNWMIKNEIDVFIPNWPQIDNVLFRGGFKKHFVDKKRDFEVYPWTLNTQADWDKMPAMKFDGVITDKPTLFIKQRP